MNTKAQAIKNRLSLRKPQADSLEILEKLADVLELKKDVDVASELSKVRALYPTCANFERDFPSVCFSLATGVGKTRLMGAFISYLYAAKGVKNYFVLAPNLTIYNKLIDDLSNPRSPKYVFRGISDFAITAPRIITGDNYAEARQSTLFKESVKINIFNISKINSEVRGGKEPRIKRLSEYLGESYFNYLSELPDLVLLMDESHHYRADSGLRAINELKPVLGLELTATPIDTKGVKFKNVVFDYPLARALQDGFVKEPAVATRRDFNPDQYRNDPKELDLIKLEDGVRIHEDTKVALDIYARDSGNRLVRPFVLVVARDTDHAKEIRGLIESDRFFEGRYTGKVMEIHSNQRGEEKEENIQRLIDLEKPENPIEIVVHVNMLKEGWDVTNLYTIIPLRAANSQILTEQTIGRGLRLPYGARTGVEKVDKLTIIAHDRFQSIVDAANDPNSIIRQENIIEIDPDALPEAQEVITASSVIEEALALKRTEIATIVNEADRQKAGFVLEAEQLITEAVSTLGASIKNINDLKSDEIRKLAFEKMITSIESNPQQNLFKTAIVEAAKQEYESVVSELIEKTIPIPRVLIQQKHDVKSGFKDFDLDVAGLNYQPVSEEIIRRTLRTNESEVLQSDSSGVARDIPENILVNELINYPEVDYDRESELLYKLARQAIAKLGNGRNDEDLENIILYHKREIGKYIYAQLQQHFYLESSGFEEPLVYPFDRIKPHNFSKYTADSVHHYTETITPTNIIPSKVFGGFKKACHNLYKFDSKAEKDFATILEKDTDVLKWLRPADAQFELYWKYNSKRYHPDFVVETVDSIFMVEIKAERDIDDSEVQEKAEAGKKYCEAATTFNLANGGKQWVYVLIPHTAVAPNMSFKGLCK
ncbi:type III restriction endonuclease subunit R [Candidatus Parcubacteria bacterium]|nr:MAG: type III restriction endonuclease subunit R [Candidatus Parcubacteria bacterium]